MTSLHTCGVLIALCLAGFGPGGVEVQASKAAGTSTRTAKPHFYDRVKVLCIGINEYTFLAAPLNQAEADARLFGESLKNQFGYEPIYLLGRDATKHDIENHIKELGNNLGVDDALIVYFAGHGTAFQRLNRQGNIPLPTRVGYLLPVDADIDLNNPQDPAWDTEAIDMRCLVDTIDGLNTHHVLLVADSCCSGFMTKRGGVEIGLRINLLKNPSRSIVAATTQRETALDGVFTKHFVSVLSGYSKRSQVASITDVFDEIRNPVVRESDRAMTPQLAHIGEGDGEFLFFPLGISTDEVRVIKSEVARARDSEKPGELTSLGRGLLSGVVRRANKRSGQQTTIAEVSVALSAPNYWYGLQAAQQANYWRAMRERFHRNAARGDVLAMAGLHFCYSRGLGESEEQPDPDAAFQWALAAEQLSPDSGVGKCLLGRCYRLGIGIEKNAMAGRQLYRDSAKAGFILGRLFDAEHALRESISPENAAKCITIQRQGLDAGIAYSAAIIGDLYATGRFGIPQDVVKALPFYKKAVDPGYIDATAVLADAYAAGKPGFPEPDQQLCENYLRQGAEHGVAMCQFLLGIEYLQCKAIGWQGWRI